MMERDIHSPTVETLLRICKALHVQASDLIRVVERE
jgi:DNA-binding Xre family transcriptional regulator